MPSVYIVLLNWNGWQDTVACLKSLSALTYSNYHIVVVDNASTDNSVSEILERFPGVEIIESDYNRGFSGGCNIGIRKALSCGAHYIWLLNNDTIVDGSALGAMVEVAERDVKIGEVGSLIYDMAAPDTLLAWGGGWVSFVTSQSGHYNCRINQSRLQYLTAASVLIRREAIEDVGLLDERRFFLYWEDVDMSFRLRDGGWHLAVASESVVFHKENGASVKGSPVLDYYSGMSAVRFFKRHSPIAIWSISVFVMGRLFRRLHRRNWRGFSASVRGLLEGLRG